MSEPENIALWRSAWVLTLLAALCTFIVGATYTLTKERIASNKRELLIAQFAPVMGSREFDEIDFDGARHIDDAALPGSAKATVYQASMKGAAVAFLYKVDTLGYAGKIELLIGIDLTHELTGVRVLDHSETPGLGDAIEVSKSDWIERFRAKSLKNPVPEQWTLRKHGGDFDQFTGASITPGAVVKAVKKTLEFVEAESTP